MPRAPARPGARRRGSRRGRARRPRRADAARRPRRDRDARRPRRPDAAFLVSVLAALSHVRAVAGRDALSVDAAPVGARADPHRPGRRPDRAVPLERRRPRRSAGDDDERRRGPSFPAIYCRHCGRSRLGRRARPVGDTTSPPTTTTSAATTPRSEGRFRRAASTRPREADELRTRRGAGRRACAGSHVARPRAARPHARRRRPTCATGRCCPCSRSSGDDADERVARRHLPVVRRRTTASASSAARSPPCCRCRCHTLFGDADARRRREEGAGLHRQRAGRRAPRRVRAEPLAHAHPAHRAPRAPSATGPLDARRAGRAS